MPISVESSITQATDDMMMCINEALPELPMNIDVETSSLPDISLLQSQEPPAALSTAVSSDVDGSNPDTAFIEVILHQYQHICV